MNLRVAPFRFKRVQSNRKQNQRAATGKSPLAALSLSRKKRINHLTEPASTKINRRLPTHELNARRTRKRATKYRLRRQINQGFSLGPQRSRRDKLQPPILSQVK